jgi:ABC-type amino acid transport substrate-binding protein
LDNGDIDAFVDDRPLLVWRIGQDFAGRLDVTTAQFDMQSYGIALPNGSPLRKPIDRALLGILADDWWTRTVQGYLGPPVR